MRTPLAFVLYASACVPDLDSDESTVSAPRVLAVVAEPAEAAPRETVRYRALVADGNGVRSDVGLIWFHCLAQKPLAELGPISQDCLRAERGKLAPLGQGASVDATIPADVCSLFGPNPPEPMMGQPPGRPIDADQSGGYRLPVILGLNAGAGDQVALHEQRVSCGLAGVTPAISAEFGRRYHANANPSAAELRVVRANAAPTTVGEAPLELAPGERVEFDVAWAACPAADQCGDGICGPDEDAQTCAAECRPPMARGCGGRERYAYFDRERSELTVRRESLRVTWYATAGQYDDERTGVAEQEAVEDSKNGWTAPAQSGVVKLWVVLRDSRGGVGVREWTVNLR